MQDASLVNASGSTPRIGQAKYSGTQLFSTPRLTPSSAGEYRPDDRVSIRRKPTSNIAVESTATSSKKTFDMKPATFDGTGSLVDYKAHFQACATINRWDDTQKGLYLAASLRVQPKLSLAISGIRHPSTMC